MTIEITDPDSGSALVFDLADDGTLENTIADYASGPGGIPCRP